MSENGKFHLITGAMYTGKTEEMDLEVHRLNFRKDINYRYFRPKLDRRPEESRPGYINVNLKKISIDESNPKSILNYLDGRYGVVAMDELNFYPGKKLRPVIEELLSRGIYIIGAALDLDSRGEVFGDLGWLLAIATKVTKKHGTCMFDGCNEDAYRTQRLINGEPAPYNSPIIAVQGTQEEVTYECRCLKHHIVPGKPKRK